MRQPFEKRHQPARGITQASRFELAGHFDLVAVKADGSGSRALASFDNMITNVGLERLLTNTSTTNNQSIVTRFEVGASSEPEHPDQTALFAPFASAQPSGSSFALYTFDSVTLETGGPYVWVATKTRRFGVGVAAGNVAEIGVGWGLTSGPLFCRALVRDALGQPTVVQVAEDEYLDVTYTLRVYIDTADKPFTLNLSSGVHDGFVRPGALDRNLTNNYLLCFGLLLSNSGTATPRWYVSSGSVGDVVGPFPSPITTVDTTDRTPVRLPYVPGSLYQDVDLTLMLNGGNIPGGFTAFLAEFYSWVSYQFQFSPAIPKTGEHIFSVRLRISIGRR